mgnify:CR=1 FL=1
MQWKKTLFMELTLREVLLTRFRVVITGKRYDLQTLKQLSDEKRIDWQLYKTPTQYVYEVRMPAFRQLTNHFLRVRYGNFEATEALFHVMQSLQEEVKKGGAV